MSATPLDILAALGENTPALHQMAQKIAAVYGDASLKGLTTSIQGTIQMPPDAMTLNTFPPRPRASKKCGYCGLLEFNPKAQYCRGCHAPHKEPA